MISFERPVHFSRGSRTERQLREGASPPPGRIPRISRLMALAIYYDDLLRTGVVKSLAELAALGHVSTTRISHIMNLLHLAPDIQERLLFLKPVLRGPDPVFLKDLQPVARQICWTKQRTAANRRLRFCPVTTM
jgi:hypothetical protein